MKMITITYYMDHGKMEQIEDESVAMYFIENGPEITLENYDFKIECLDHKERETRNHKEE